MNIHYLKKFRKKAFDRYKFIRIGKDTYTVYDYKKHEDVSGVKITPPTISFGIHWVILKKLRSDYILMQYRLEKYKKDNKQISNL